ncbi:sensor histidine kinase [Frondihabitans sp. VKM Ac-2883]|uniref:sensor histidine kinase n=1 Tax=Frondihabitans sp. VKM Ac-2883 TaxID=2783823 RepID=UPI00188CAD0E|nr:ATP-binding protein [Frondihabitans sp. VKM Ac-2883]MBF4577569.1 hypothetical protein [Frondihabitans sp. VKM Ac-2883]
MAATLAVVAVMLLLLALPAFVTTHRPDQFAFMVVSLILAGLMVAALPLALILHTEPARFWLWIPVAAYVGLLLLEPFTLRNPLPTGSAPWLLGLSLITFGCTALAEVNPWRAGILCAGITAALISVYVGPLTASNTFITFFGLFLLAVALIVGVRALRRRADKADTAEQQAQLLFEDQQRLLATEAERVRTDALLHDTVLAAFLAAAGNHAPERATSMARAALDLVSSTSNDPGTQPGSVSVGAFFFAPSAELAPFRGMVTFDLAFGTLEVPSEVADALMSATVQALTNSAKHAGAAATRSVTGTRLKDGGIHITVSDNGAGFDLDQVPEERLGVRVSILERVQHIGGTAHIRSAPGKGTTVTLNWRPDPPQSAPTRRPGQALLSIIPRRLLYRVLGALIIIAVLIAFAEAFVNTHQYTTAVSSALGLAVLPTLIQGAKQGSMTNRAAWVTTSVGVVLCSIANIGLNPANFDSASAAKLTCGVLAGAAMAWMAGRRLGPLIIVTALVTQITLWAGPEGVIRLGLAGEIVIAMAGLLIHRALREIAAAAELAAQKHHDLTIRQAELDAFNNERQQRLQHANGTAAPMLRQILDSNAELDNASRTECRVLEQALRDEIRGRALLNPAIRQVVSGHRRRGTLVQVLDDGGLDGISHVVLNAILDDVARQLEPVRSSRIVIRTGQPDSDTAITIVASTPDETAAALGLDADDEVDLWLTIPHPDQVQLAA